MNVSDSPLVHLADSAIVTPAGPEGAVAATKSFSAQLVILARIAVNLAEYKSLISTSIVPVSISKLRTDLNLLPGAIAKSLDNLQRHIGNYDWARSRGLDVDQPRYLTKFIG